MNLICQKNIVFLVVLVLLLISACTSQSNQSPDINMGVPVDSGMKIPESPNTKIPVPTNTPDPSDTPAPSDTPFPTNPSTSTSTSTKTARPSATPTDIPEGVELVKLRTSDGVDLAGYLHRPESPKDEFLAVVLTHGFTGSHADLADIEKIFITNGYTTMTFDYRGHGESSGMRLWNTLAIDTVAIFKYLKRQGFERIICIGGSMGGLGCLSGAIDDDISGVVMIASRMNPQDGSRLVTKTDLEKLKIPKIFMIAEQDMFGPEFVEQFLEMAEIAAEPKDIYIYPGPSHAFGLLYDENGEEVMSILLGFVNSISE